MATDSRPEDAVSLVNVEVPEAAPLPSQSPTLESPPATPPADIASSLPELLAPVPEEPHAETPSTTQPVGSGPELDVAAGVPEAELEVQTDSESSEQELLLRVPLELSLPTSATLQDLRVAIDAKLKEAQLEPIRDPKELALGIGGQTCDDPDAQPLRTLVPRSLVSLVEDSFEAAEVAALGLCLGVPQLHAMQAQSQLLRSLQAQAVSWRPVQGIRPRVDEAMREKLYKTRLCVNYAQAQCTYGQRCTFAHGEHELRKRVMVPLGMMSVPGCVVPEAPMGASDTTQEECLGSDRDKWNNWTKWDGKNWNDWNEWKTESWWGDWSGGTAWKQGDQWSKDWSQAAERDLDGELDDYWGLRLEEGSTASLKLAPAAEEGSCARRLEREADERCSEDGRRACSHRSPGRRETHSGAGIRGDGSPAEGEGSDGGSCRGRSRGIVVEASAVKARSCGADRGRGRGACRRSGTPTRSRRASGRSKARRRRSCGSQRGGGSRNSRAGKRRRR